MKISARKYQSHRGGEKHYQTKAHRLWRKKVLEKSKGLCVYCLDHEIENQNGTKTRIVTKATVGDHINPISRGGDPLDINNGQGLCKYHHDVKSINERWTL
jgi:5-methylcytosine-specific restriction endonuclease McrA